MAPFQGTRYKLARVYRFFHECCTDPLLAAVLGLAVLLALGMAAAIAREKLERRRRRQELERTRTSLLQKASKNR